MVPIDADAPSVAPDHPESVASTNFNPVTRNFDAAGLQEAGQDEPAKKKVYHIPCSDTADAVT